MGHFELKLASPWPRVVSVIALPSRTAHLLQFQSNLKRNHTATRSAMNACSLARSLAPKLRTDT